LRRVKLNIEYFARKFNNFQFGDIVRSVAGMNLCKMSFTHFVTKVIHNLPKF